MLVSFSKRLQLQSLKAPIQEQYTRLLLQFGKEIEHTSKIYQKHKSDPPIGRDLPPIAGRISWARQLYRRIQVPMDSFNIHPTILKDPDAKKVIKSYNKTSRVLVEFECLYYQAWSKQVLVLFVCVYMYIDIPAYLCLHLCVSYAFHVYHVWFVEHAWCA